jgi:2-C-methyl-D-erythritol 4-phosphate cytidylyltransferase
MTLPLPPTSVILLAGGAGARMLQAIPKQYLSIGGKQMAHHSMDVFLSIPEITEIIIVCEEQYRANFEAYNGSHTPISFASPGKRRQDSVYSGLQAVCNHNQLICIHDSARPLVDRATVYRVIHAAHLDGAAIAAMPLKFTVKEVSSNNYVQKTLDRSCLWEIQTPQAASFKLLQEGFRKANQENITVTDDASLIELTGNPIKVVEGSYANLKITTTEDLLIAETLMKEMHGT